MLSQLSKPLVRQNSLATRLGTPQEPPYRFLLAYTVAANTPTPIECVEFYPGTRPRFRANPSGANLNSSVSGARNGMQVSPDGRHLAIALAVTPFVAAYQIINSQASAVPLNSPQTLPASTGQSIAWSPNGKWLAVAHSSTPFVTLYRWNNGFGDKVADPSTLPAGTGRGLGWSPDSAYLGVTHSGSPFVSVYPITDDGFGSKVSDPVGLGAAPDCIQWSPDGTWVVIVGTNTPYILGYPWSAGFGTKVSDPSPSLAAPGANNQTRWHPSGNYLLYTSTVVSKPVTVIAWNAGFGTQYTGYDVVPGSFTNNFREWSPDGKFIICGVTNSAAFRRSCVQIWPFTAADGSFGPPLPELPMSTVENYLGKQAAWLPMTPR